MSSREELIILAVGLIVVTVLSKIITGKIRKHLSAAVAPYTFLFIAVLGLYYLLDIVFNISLFYTNIYFYFWLIIIISQFLFFILAKKKVK